MYVRAVCCGVKINRFNSSFPVGKIRMEYMYPMNFEEFLMATGKEMLLNKILDIWKKCGEREWMEICREMFRNKN